MVPESVIGSSIWDKWKILDFSTENCSLNLAKKFSNNLILILSCPLVEITGNKQDSPSKTYSVQILLLKAKKILSHNCCIKLPMFNYTFQSESETTQIFILQELTPLTLDQLLEAHKMHLIKIGFIFPLAIMEDHPQLLSVVPNSTDQEAKLKPRMLLIHLSVIVKDLISKWKLVPSLVEILMSLESQLKLMKLGIMFLVLSYSMIGASETSKHGSMFLWVHSLLKTVFQPYHHGLLLWKH